MRICDLNQYSIRICDQLELIKNNSNFTFKYIKCLRTRQKYSKICLKYVEETLTNHLMDLYGLNPNIPHRATMFPRLPPGISHPMFKIFENPNKEKFNTYSESMNSKLQGFQGIYQQHASGLFEMNPAGIIPPGHPLYSRQRSVDSLKNENQTNEKVEP